MALQYRNACSRVHIINSSHSIRARRRQFVTRLIETGVKNFVGMASEFLDNLAGAHIPEARRSIDTSGEAIVACEIELSA